MTDPVPLATSGAQSDARPLATDPATAPATAPAADPATSPAADLSAAGAEPPTPPRARPLATSPAPPLARWRHESPWARAALAAILVGSAVVMSWNLARGGDSSFYEAAARSMSQSWRALFFGAFDPAATVTLDKLAGFAIPQALAIRLFGMSTSAVALPQVIEGLVTVLACAVVGLRWGGRASGLVAALAAASTPIFVSMFGHPMEDGLLTMSLAVALVWWQRATLTARLWPLLMAAAFVAVGFQAKMMSAWFVLPALAAGTVIAAPTVRRGLRRAAVVVGASVAMSLAWITAIALTPAGDRPYIDGSTDNDVFAMVFGYNGLDRVVPGAVPGSVGAPAHGGISSSLAALSRAFGPHTIRAVAAGSSPTKLLEMPLVTQIGWLYPAALAGLALALWRFWPRRTRAIDRERLALVAASGVWLATAAAVLSATRVPHTAYVAALGVPLVLLAAMAWREGMGLLRAPRRSLRLVLPGLLVVQGGWAALLASETRLPAALVVGAGVVLAAGVALGLIAAWPRPTHRASTHRTSPPPTSTHPTSTRLAPPPPAPDHPAPLDGSLAQTRTGPAMPSRTGVRHTPVRARLLPGALALALVCAPVAASLQVLDQNRDGTGGDASVGIAEKSGRPDETFTISPPALWGGSPRITPAIAQLVAAAQAHGGGIDGAPLLVSDSWAISAQIIDATGANVLTDGGYSGHVPVFTASALRTMQREGRVHLFAVAWGAPESDPVREVATGPGCRELQHWTLNDPGEGGDVNKVAGFALYTCPASAAGGA